MRLFLAVNFPDELRRRLWDATESLRARTYPVTWVRRDLIHLTVKFLGEVDDARLPEIEAAVAKAARGIRPFPLPMAGLGAFPPRGRVRVVWVGCESVPPLELLHHGVERAMGDLGFPLEGRPFRPHVTVGRARRDAAGGALNGLPDALRGMEFHGEAMVTSVDLMQSTLGRGGPTYARRFQAMLEA